MFRFVLFLLAAGTFIPSIAQNREARLGQLIGSTFGAHPEMIGVLVHVESPDQQISCSYAAGYDGTSSSKPLNADQPLLVASNTKTFVAAAILRLAEKEKLSIEAPVVPLLTESSRKVLAVKKP